MAITITRLLGYDGPNLYGPQPSVVLQVRSARDDSAQIRAALKDSALSVGVIHAYLDVAAHNDGGDVQITATFVTPTPALGVELARYVVAGLNAQAAGDDTWDAEEPLWTLQQQRRRTALPLLALQLCAVAAQRGIPAFQRADGSLQLGHGARSLTLDLAPLRQKHADPPAIPWDDLGAIPIIAVSGGDARDHTAQRYAEMLRAQGHAVGLACNADFAATRVLLGGPHTIAVVGLDPAGIAARGLGFARCAAAAIVDLPDALPPHVGDRAELACVLGVPMLVTAPAGVVALAAHPPEIAALAAHAPCRVVGLDAQDIVSSVPSARYVMRDA